MLYIFSPAKELKHDQQWNTHIVSLLGRSHWIATSDLFAFKIEKCYLIIKYKKKYCLIHTVFWKICSKYWAKIWCSGSKGWENWTSGVTVIFSYSSNLLYSFQAQIKRPCKFHSLELFFFKLNLHVGLLFFKVKFFLSLRTLYLSVLF